MVAIILGSTHISLVRLLLGGGLTQGRPQNKVCRYALLATIKYQYTSKQTGAAPGQAIMAHPNACSLDGSFDKQGDQVYVPTYYGPSRYPHNGYPKPKNHQISSSLWLRQPSFQDEGACARVSGSLARQYSFSASAAALRGGP